MKALVYHGPGQRAWETKPRPTIRERGDAIVRITTSTICGTDLHILKGDVPSVTPGRILGHEGVGVIEAIGSSVTSFHPGDLGAHLLHHSLRDLRLLPTPHAVPLPDRWLDPGEHDRWDSSRITCASLMRTRACTGSRRNLDLEAVVLLSDILPTVYECGVLNGDIKPGDTVAIVGAGPIGLAALLTAQLYSPSAIDDRPRRQPSPDGRGIRRDVCH